MKTKRELIMGGLAASAAALAPCGKSPPAASGDAASSAPPPPPPPEPDTVTVALFTDKGEIDILLERKKAPITVANFLRYLDAGKLKGAVFWRSAHSGPDGFIQATASGHPFPGIPHESTKDTGLSHTNGAISMSRFEPGTAKADFVICIGDNTQMDYGRDGSSDKLGYAAFGHVVKGMDVVRGIWNGKIDKHTREGGWAGQMLATPITVTDAKRIGESYPAAAGSASS